MKYAEFIIDLTGSIERKLVGRGLNIEVRSVVKSNDNVRDGLIISDKKEKIAPTFYMDDLYNLYEKGADIEEIADMIAGYSIIQMPEDLSVISNPEMLYDFEKVKDHITYKILNRERNRKYLEDAVYVEFLDLAVLFYHTYIIGNERHVYALKITEDMLYEWGVSKELLLEISKKNTPEILGIYLREAFDILGENGEEDGIMEEAHNDEARCPIYILSNKTHSYGASNILTPGVLSGLAEKMEDDLYIIPSSVHEVMIVPVNTNLKKETVNDMIKDINSSMLDSMDVLADHVYIYHRQDNAITM